ncbi:unnamed protein product [Rotaria sp. Silwood2]|nr:unnamed protein product [Rotaria sp. Silwood2]CAF2927513.1 unnamed protein product [Rotaria sp. Silwood2]CAF2945166.1 unnamed protein product [Rotaria sp. Silwood2]CAF3380855.1 unnamed protein product [Rotaria sp. Silwood2]CAF4179337.1 unnamed protein product [Rotaria sp. Silwood2]
MNSKSNPTFAHLSVIIHLFGTVRFVFEMSEAERTKFSGAWSWYEHHLNIATKLFTIDHDFPSKSMIVSPSISPKQKTLKQLIMYLDFNIFPLSVISVKHPITEKTGITKNRPALGERALQELIMITYSNLIIF